MTTDLLVLGSGVAGLWTALHAAVRGLRVTLLTKGEVGHSATRYAQGGIAAALGPDDSPELHLSDTLSAGAGLCDPEAVRVLVTDGPRRVRDLMAMGARFDPAGDGGAGAPALAREGGHSTPRVVHAGGDATGAEIERALVAALSASEVEVRPGWFALELLVESGRCAGAVALDPHGEAVEVRAAHTVLASGGAGQLFSVTTNPPPSTGDGLAMALRAGVCVADAEFMQFHPTALHHPSIPRPLLSEALRGEGAVLRDEQGVAFMASEHALADLAPRDVVARAVASRLIDRGLPHLWLDATGIPAFERRFPTIWRACRQAGLDPSREWLPVAPAAHYLSGGVLTDLDGATSLPGLWAVGEVACTGVHGANRLASNSLLEGLVFAPRAVEAVVAGKDGPEPTGAMREVLASPVSPPSSVNRPRVASPPVHRPHREATLVRRRQGVAELRARVQETMTAGAGVVRSAASLEGALQELEAVATRAGPEPGPGIAVAWWELRNLVDVGRALCQAALAREESRGAHFRLDFPEPSPRFLGRFVHGGAELRFVPLSPSGSRVP